MQEFSIEKFLINLVFIFIFENLIGGTINIDINCTPKLHF